MEKLSGLVLDIYDDKDADVLRSIWGTAEELPDLVKQAQKVTPELEARVPDHLYALVMHDGDVTLRKFACIDAGNTALSVEYFLKTGHKLPAEAQKVAAANLQTACGWYGIEPPEQLEKVAFGIGKMVSGALTATMLPGIAKDVKSGLNAVKGQGGHIMTPAQQKLVKYQGGM